MRLTFFLSWLLWWTSLTAIYCGLMLTLDALLTAWNRQRKEQTKVRQQLARVDDQVYGSAQRICAAFVVARQLIRDEAAVQRGDRR